MTRVHVKREEYMSLGSVTKANISDFKERTYFLSLEVAIHDWVFCFSLLVFFNQLWAFDKSLFIYKKKKKLSIPLSTN